MIELFDINTLLFAGKWLFIGVIYLFLFVVLIAVRREMGLRIGGRERLPTEAPGRLRVRSPGGDSRLQIGAVFNLNPETRLGAGADNDIVLSDPFISSQHVSMVWDGVEWWVKDLGSKNGTFIGEVRLLPMKPNIILVGATIRLGEVVLELLE
jgi:hypothetical protein